MPPRRVSGLPRWGLALNLGVLACSAVHTSRAALAVAGAGACLVGVVLLAHAVAMTTRVGRALAARLGHTVWFYLAASAAMLAGVAGACCWLSWRLAPPMPTRVQGLPHVHLNLLGWVGLAVVGTRGAPRGDVAALEDLLLRVSALVEAHPEIVELDCNPCLMGWWWSTPGSGARWLARRRRWPPAAADRERAMEPGHRRPGTGQVWTGTLVPWSSR